VREAMMGDILRSDDATVEFTIEALASAPIERLCGANNRTHMVRIPEAGRFQLRLMDGAANPYPLQVGVLADGLDGITRQLDPGGRLDTNMYEQGAAPAGIPRLPLNLLDASSRASSSRPNSLRGRR
jgi:glutamine synthetase